MMIFTTMPPHKRSKNGSTSYSATKKHRPNLGRQQLRTVKRTARRDIPHDEPEVQEPSEEEEEESEQLEEPKSSKHFQDGKAYDALLTLLSADHKQIKTTSKSSGSKVTEVEDIAGLNVDEAEENDEESADESEVEEEVEENENILNKDPFELHFNLISEDFVESKAKAIGEKQKWPISGKERIEKLAYFCTSQTAPGPKLEGGVVSTSNQFEDYTSIKKRVYETYLNNYGSKLSPLDQSLLQNLLSYKDINYPTRTYKNTSYRKLYITHVLNHIFKTRDRVLKNNDKLHNYQSDLKSGKLKPGSQEPELRDQGFTRPKVLILLPTRNAAYEVVEQMIKLSGSDQQENRKKFKAQFYEEGQPPETKPDDFRHIFKGNSNDFFSIGLKFTRKSIKLYSSFYSSDVLIASPIGLSMILEDPKQSKRQYDFLSSIEVMVIDNANQIEMQNWDHVGTVLKYVNKIPKDFHGADFSRIRMWAINDHARLLRQTLVFSEFLTPSVNSIVSKSQNIAGKVRYRPEISSQTCIMNSIGLKIKQIFQRFESPDPQSTYEARFKFFVNSVLPSITKQTSYEDGLLIFIPSYFDYVRVKTYMKNNTKFDFGTIDEYSSQSKVSRARQGFLTGKIKMLLYTERIHHFRRFELSGVKNVLIYEPPSNPLFYKELLRFVGKSVFKSEADIDLSFVKTIYSKWDAVTLERIVGNERAPVLCNSVNEMYEFR
ncbi:CIC11C00000000308 [Sungouiella intermedia]|uniref:U3 small nucleolar RNA-associated protein 25 n=1 Tax=Sungouiella intermedia TaxID=45354 RepID=A0A1L0FWZ1_9ASCO|nr:CIC11C00000000308 [[Candida] intermedia]